MFANKVERTQISNPILMFFFAFVLERDKWKATTMIFNRTEKRINANENSSHENEAR